MGAWGHHILENDTACDTFAGIVNAANPVRDLLSVVEHYATPPEEQYLEDDEVNEILVTILFLIGFRDRQVMAKRFAPGVVGDRMQTEFASVIEGKQREFDTQVTPAVYESALALFDRVFDPKNSETYELWIDAGNPQPWKEHVEALQADLRGVAHTSVKSG